MRGALDWNGQAARPNIPHPNPPKPIHHPLLTCCPVNCALSSATLSFSSASSTATITTLKPCTASRSTMARPMPLLPPWGVHGGDGLGGLCGVSKWVFVCDVKGSAQKAMTITIHPTHAEDDPKSNPQTNAHYVRTVTSAHSALYFFLRSCGPSSFITTIGPV